VRPAKAARNILHGKGGFSVHNLSHAQRTSLPCVFPGHAKKQEPENLEKKKNLCHTSSKAHGKHF
jgi:hypothetical protein